MNLTEFIACAKFKNKGNSGLSENQIEQYTQRRREYTFRNATENSRMVRRGAGWDEEDGFREACPSGRWIMRQIVRLGHDRFACYSDGVWEYPQRSALRGVDE